MFVMNLYVNIVKYKGLKKKKRFQSKLWEEYK